MNKEAAMCVSELQRKNILSHLNSVAKNYLSEEISLKTFLHNFELSIQNMDLIEQRLMRDQFDYIVHKLSNEFLDPEQLMPQTKQQ